MRLARAAARVARRGSVLDVTPIDIVAGDFSDARVISLLREHLVGMRASSPACAVHALEVSGLRRADITFVTAWANGELLGCGALKQLDATHGELKSMRTATAHLRKGVGAQILEHLLGLARGCGYRRVSLETGTGPAFEPAVAMYRRHGFQSGGAFGDYEATEFNQFMFLEL